VIFPFFKKYTHTEKIKRRLENRRRLCQHITPMRKIVDFHRLQRPPQPLLSGTKMGYRSTLKMVISHKRLCDFPHPVLDILW